MIHKIKNFEEHVQKLVELVDGKIINDYQIKGRNGSIYFYTLDVGIHCLIFDTHFIKSPADKLFILDFSEYNIDYVLAYSIINMSIDVAKEGDIEMKDRHGFMIMNKENKFVIDVQKQEKNNHITFLFTKEALQKNGLEQYKEFIDNNSFANFDALHEISMIRSAIQTTFNYQSDSKYTTQKHLLQSLFSLAFEYFDRRINVLDVSDKKENQTMLSKMYAIKDKITSTLDQKPNIQELEEQFNLSSKQLNTEFKKVFGKPILSFYNHFRIYKSRDLLISKEMSVKEITYALGFTDMPHFSKKFKQEFHVSPSDYLKNYGL